jgi:hypothetical protein
MCESDRVRVRPESCLRGRDPADMISARYLKDGRWRDAGFSVPLKMRSGTDGAVAGLFSNRVNEQSNFWRVRIEPVFTCWPSTRPTSVGGGGQGFDMAVDVDAAPDLGFGFSDCGRGFFGSLFVVGDVGRGGEAVVFEIGTAGQPLHVLVWA